MPRSTFYYHLKASKTDKYFADKQAIKEVFEGNAQRYGYRRITLELQAKGMTINHKKVLRLMKMLGLHGKRRKNERYHSYKGEVGKVADNILNRDFTAVRAFEKLATGNCMDNGAMECFFGRLKVEMFYGEKFASVEDFMQKLHEYIYYWNNERISLKLKGMSPVQYRTHH